MIRVNTRPGTEVVCKAGKRRFSGTVVHMIPAQKGRGIGCAHGPLALVCHRSNHKDKHIDGLTGVRAHFGGEPFRTDYEVWGTENLFAIV